MRDIALFSVLSSHCEIAVLLIQECNPVATLQRGYSGPIRRGIKKIDFFPADSALHISRRLLAERGSGHYQKKQTHQGHFFHCAFLIFSPYRICWKLSPYRKTNAGSGVWARLRRE